MIFYPVFSSSTVETDIPLQKESNSMQHFKKIPIRGKIPRNQKRLKSRLLENGALQIYYNDGNKDVPVEFFTPEYVKKHLLKPNQNFLYFPIQPIVDDDNVKFFYTEASEKTPDQLIDDFCKHYGVPRKWLDYPQPIDSNKSITLRLKPLPDFCVEHGDVVRQLESKGIELSGDYTISCENNKCILTEKGRVSLSQNRILDLFQIPHGAQIHMDNDGNLVCVYANF